MALNPVHIHGREYRTVAQRIGILSDLNPGDYSLVSDLIFNEGDIVIVKSILTIHGKDGDRIYTGMAEEDRTKGQINKTSALENCETSAIGRALAAAGLGGEEYASANEVENAIHQQEQTPPTSSSNSQPKNNKSKQPDPDVIAAILKGERILKMTPPHLINAHSKYLKVERIEDAEAKNLQEYLDHLRKIKADQSAKTKTVVDVIDGDIVKAVN